MGAGYTSALGGEKGKTSTSREIKTQSCVIFAVNLPLLLFSTAYLVQYIIVIDHIWIAEGTINTLKFVSHSGNLMSCFLPQSWPGHHIFRTCPGHVPGRVLTVSFSTILGHIEIGRVQLS